jgi:hypothetical protein
MRWVAFAPSNPLGCAGVLDLIVNILTFKKMYNLIGIGQNVIDTDAGKQLSSAFKDTV